MVFIKYPYKYFSPYYESYNFKSDTILQREKIKAPTTIIFLFCKRIE